MGGLYFFLGLVSLLGTWSAIVQARRLYLLSLVYMFAGWLTGELALIHLLWQAGLTSLMAFTGLLEGGYAQAGLGMFALSWIGLVYENASVGHSLTWVRTTAARYPRIDGYCWRTPSAPRPGCVPLSLSVKVCACIPTLPTPRAASATCWISTSPGNPGSGVIQCCYRCTVVAG